MLQSRRFAPWASRSGYSGAAICVAALRNSIVFCNSVSADRSGMVASRFLAAAGACVILLCFAAENRKSYNSGSMKVSNGAWQQIFLHFGVDDFPFKNNLKKSFKIIVLPLAHRDPVLELQFV